MTFKTPPGVRSHSAALQPIFSESFSELHSQCAGVSRSAGLLQRSSRLEYQSLHMSRCIFVCMLCNGMRRR